MGLRGASFLFGANMSRTSLITLALSSMLFMQYIEQHKLKIITEVTPLTDQQIEDYMRQSEEADRKMVQMFMGLDDDQPEEA
jgi:hypothetical protein